MAGTLGIGLFGMDHTDVIEELVPEPGIEQVQRGVLHAAVVPVHGAPILLCLAGDGSRVVVGIHIAQIVPAGAGPLGHGVRLTLGRAAAAGAGGVDPVGHLGDGALAVIGGLVAVHLGQQQRQLFLGDGHPTALGAVDQGDGLAPVTLAGEHPVAELEVDLLAAPSLLHGILLHGGDGLFDAHAVEEAGVDHDGGVVLGDEGLFGDVAALDHLHDGQAELGGKLPVALVVARHAHDDAGTVAHQHVIGHEHGHHLAGGGIGDLHALEANAGLVLVQLAALKVGLPGGSLLIGRHLIPVADAILPLFQQRMLRGDNGVGDAEQGVSPGGIHGNGIAHVGLESDLRAAGAADPVALLRLDAVDEIHAV